MTDVLPLETTEELEGVTLTRAIGSLSFFSGTVAGAWGKQILDIGIGIASREAVTAGVVPDPNVAADRPPRGWLYRARRVVEQNGAGAPIVLWVPFDIRAQRRMDEADLFLAINSTGSTGTAFTTEAAVLIRFLLLLS